MPSPIKNPFKRHKSEANKDKLVLKKADKNTTEISIARVEKSQVSPEPAPKPVNEKQYMDMPTLERLLQQRNNQIASLKNELADAKFRLNVLEDQASSCTCGAYKREARGPMLNNNFTKW